MSTSQKEKTRRAAAHKTDDLLVTVPVTTADRVVLEIRKFIAEIGRAHV